MNNPGWNLSYKNFVAGYQCLKVNVYFNRNVNSSILLYTDSKIVLLLSPEN